MTAAAAEMRRGRIPELGLFLLAYQLLQNIGLTNIPPVTLATIAAQVPAPPPVYPRPPPQHPRTVAKPNYTYTDLITLALKDKTALTVSGIYQWIS